MYSEDADIETCDLRLTTVENATKPSTTTDTTNKATTSQTTTLPARENFTKVAWQDVAFFRFGYFNYQKLNLVSMVNKFKNGTWYKVDLLIDWNTQSVTIYIDNKQLASDKFFTNSKTTIKTANSIVLYNLTPGGKCRVKSLMVCPDRCDSKYSFFNSFSIIYLYLCFRGSSQAIEHAVCCSPSLVCLLVIVIYVIHSIK